VSLDEFICRYLGKKVDFDGAYGAQCVDLFRQYLKDVYEVPEHTGAVDGAKDLFLKHTSLPKQQLYLKAVKRGIPKVGDILVWGATQSNAYGHVAICLTKIGNYVCVLEQNGITQAGTQLSWRALGDTYLGLLRRK